MAAEWARDGEWSVRLTGWVGSVAGWDESSAVGWVVEVESESRLVDSDVVMEPTERCQVVGMVVAAVDTVFDVVDLEAVAAVAS